MANPKKKILPKKRSAKFGAVFAAADAQQKPQKSGVKFGGSMACGGMVK